MKEDIKKNSRKSAKQGKKWKFIIIAVFLVSGWCYPDWIKEQYTDLLDLIQFVHILHGILEPVLIPIGAFFCSILETMKYGEFLECLFARFAGSLKEHFEK